MLMLATIWQGILTFLFVVVGLLMIGIILLQKNRGAGLSGAFGGVGGHSAFGPKTGDSPTGVTVGMPAFLILLASAATSSFTPTSTAEAMGIQAPAPALPALPPVQPGPSKPGTAMPSPAKGTTGSMTIPIQPAPPGNKPATGSPAGSAPPATTPPAPPPSTPPSPAPSN